MAKHTLLVSEKIPWPARKLQLLIEQLLKVRSPEALRVIRDGQVYVNGRVARRANEMLEPGDKLDVEYQPAEPKPVRGASSSSEAIEVVYLDDQIVVANKPPQLLTVPTPHREHRTMISELERLLRKEGTGDKLFCVHRLDRGVSGLLVFAKSLEVAMSLRDQFAERKPERRYVALVAGELKKRSGTFRSHLATDKKSLSRYSTEDEEEGELAITHYQALQSWSAATLVEVRLETGRRNQIRVHFAEAGHPVLGDSRYGHRELTALWPHRRLALHAVALGFAQPSSQKALAFESPLPDEMLAFIRKNDLAARRERTE